MLNLKYFTVTYESFTNTFYKMLRLQSVALCMMFVIFSLKLWIFDLSTLLMFVVNLLYLHFVFLCCYIAVCKVPARTGVMKFSANVDPSKQTTRTTKTEFKF